MSQAWLVDGPGDSDNRISREHEDMLVADIVSTHSHILTASTI